MELPQLQQLTKLIRYYILLATTKGKSGHPTSSLSAADLLTVLFFSGYFKTNLDDPKFYNNDRLIFSKGHASPLLYALYAAAGHLTEKDLSQYRTFDSPLEGHPSMRFPFTEAATGSLGQGLSIGMGMAINAKVDQLPYRTYVLLGDSEMSEGQNYEALQLAAHYQLDNLIGIMDVNRLGQTGETMLGWDVEAYRQRIESFGWQTYIIHDGHDLSQIKQAYEFVLNKSTKPSMIIAKTVKGKGISFLENKLDWHGKALTSSQYTQALEELGDIDKALKVKPQLPSSPQPTTIVCNAETAPEFTDPMPTRDAYGQSLIDFAYNPHVFVLDAEVSNSTKSAEFQKICAHRFLEMYIAEQNMVSAAVGLSARGKKPFVSTFAAFFTRAFDQIRMAAYSQANICFVGSHAGISIGEDGPSQMGLEDLSLFRSILNSVILYPCDGVSTHKIVHALYQHVGLSYLRTTREATPQLYNDDTQFSIGGSHTLRQSPQDTITVIAAGITVHEALKAYQQLQKQHCNLRIIDLYSIKPFDEAAVLQAAQQTQAIITIEDHYSQGGIGEAIGSFVSRNVISTPVYSLAVDQMPRSASATKLRSFAKIDSQAIIQLIKTIQN